MAHPKDEDAYPVDTIVRLKATGQFARVVDRTFLKDGVGFLNYIAEIEGRSGRYAIYHDDVELENLPAS